MKLIPSSKPTVIAPKDSILSYLYEIVQPGDLIITIGAGDIWTVAQELATLLKDKKVF